MSLEAATGVSAWSIVVIIIAVVVLLGVMIMFSMVPGAKAETKPDALAKTDRPRRPPSTEQYPRPQPQPEAAAPGPRPQARTPGGAEALLLPSPPSRDPSSSLPASLLGDLLPQSLRSEAVSPEAPARVVLPPPLVPALILPNAAVRFLIEEDQITRATSSGSSELSITSPSGKQLLQVLVEISPSGSKSIAVCSPGCEDDPRAVISNDPSGGDLKIMGKGGSFYGVLRPSYAGGSWSVYMRDNVVLTVERGGQFPSSLLNKELKFKAISPDGTEIATAGIESSMSGDLWKLQAQPAVDAVLVVACMLAMLLGLSRL